MFTVKDLQDRIDSLLAAGRLKESDPVKLYFKNERDYFSYSYLDLVGGDGALELYEQIEFEENDE